MEAYEQLEEEDDDPSWRDYELTPTELESFLYARGREAGLERGLERGRDEGRARALLDLLQDRGFDPDPEVGARILSCRDSARLRAWLARAATIARLDELFE